MVSRLQICQLAASAAVDWAKEHSVLEMSNLSQHVSLQLSAMKG